MTPKQKAFELYFKFYRDIIADNDKAKQCAVIAVDEALKSRNNLYGVISKKTKFYLEVKQEIEKL